MLGLGDWGIRISRGLGGGVVGVAPFVGKLATRERLRKTVELMLLRGNVLRIHKSKVAGGREEEYLYLAHNVRDPKTGK